MGGWTEVGRQIQSLSRHCQSNVQCLSTNGLLQGLSSRCLTPVKSLSNLWHLGQTLDIYPVLVHSPSIGNHNCQSWTKSGQTCNLDIVRTRLGLINLKGGSSSEVLDKLWTDLVPRQTLDKVWISWLCHQPTQSSNIQSMTKSGQMLNLDNVWTNLGFITSKRDSSGEFLINS